MQKRFSQATPYLISALLGAVGGGLLVMVATKAIPTMLSNMMCGCMGKMMSNMQASGFNPPEM